MLKQEDNDLLTLVHPGTPMGEMLREYWTPAVRSASLVADGAPERVRLLGRNYVAFRTTDGRVGFLDEGCPHRGASLALGRNEENGLRCIFHGWKITADGKVVDTPCEPAERRERFAANLKVNHYPVREAGGMVWVYLGKRKELPAFPEFEFNTLPASHVHVRRAIVHYNWLQGVEAHIDVSHVGVLHSGFLNASVIPGLNRRDLSLATANKAPKMELNVVRHGIREAALRNLGDGNQYARVREIVLPYFTFIPMGSFDPCHGRASVPIDDEWNAEWYIVYDPDKPLDPAEMDLLFQNTGPTHDNFASNLGSVDNLWHQDRAAMSKHWSGFPGNIPFEDFIIQESMGPRIDRSTEQLGTADAIVVAVRHQLLEGIRAFQKGAPAPWHDGVDFAKIRSLAATIDASIDWRTVDTIAGRGIERERAIRMGQQAAE